MNQPWLWEWNYDLFQVLFTYIPASPRAVDWCQFLILNPLLSSWIFAAVFYHYWTKDDERRPLRRSRLVETLLALCVVIFVSLILRLWVRWPAPNLSPPFQQLFPRYLWATGNGNCFPSHSTLTYFTIAAGFSSLSRRTSLGLALATVSFISFPRVYLGGHYPIDVLFSCVLAVLGLLLVRRWWQLPDSVVTWLAREKPLSPLREGLFFLWIFELGEGFHSSELLFGVARHWWLRIH